MLVFLVLHHRDLGDDIAHDGVRVEVEASSRTHN
jgi:hypothetical protein